MTDDLQAFYGRWAGLYDRIARVPGVGAWREAAARALELAPGDTVVEMGCGTGANFPYLRERVGPRGTVIGVDLTAEMLAVAAKRIAANGWENAHLVRADAACPPVRPPTARSSNAPIDGSAATNPDGRVESVDPAGIEPGAVDAVLASFVVGMFSEPAPVVERWCSLLGPGGRLCLLDAAHSARPFARPLDLAFRAFVVASTPPTLQFRYDDPPWAELDRRVAAAHGTLSDACTDVRRSTHGLGFVRLASGRVR